MIGFEFKNLNPKNKKTADCVIRALTVATGDSYEVIRDELIEIMKKTGYMINSKNAYERLLKARGWVKHKQPRYPDGLKFKVGEIGYLIKENESAVVSLANHLTAIEKGKIVDTWDCRHKTIGNYYTKGGVKND